MPSRNKISRGGWPEHPSGKTPDEYTNSGSGWRVIRYCSGHFWCPSGNSPGPVLFLVYINDLPEYLKSSQLRLFADDSIIFKTIKSQKDCDSLQEDLDAAARWESDLADDFPPRQMLSPYNNKQEKSCRT